MLPPLKRIDRMNVKDEMNSYSYYRKSTGQWIYACDGVIENTNYTFRYSHKFKFIALCIMVLNIDSDLLGLVT